MSQEDLVKFWINSAKDDLIVARDNFKLGHYHWSLFFYQLVLEKTLKSLIVQRGEVPDPVHNLVKLSNQAKIKLGEAQNKDFVEISTFNIEARYDDIKQSFYKKANKEFVQKWAKKCEEYFLWLKKQ